MTNEEMKSLRVIEENSHEYFQQKKAKKEARLREAWAESVGLPGLLAVAEEIANDPKCDLVSSERRIRLYAAITKARGNLIMGAKCDVCLRPVELPQELCEECKGYPELSRIEHCRENG